MTAPTPVSTSTQPSSSLNLGPDTLIAIIGSTLQFLLSSQVNVQKEDLAWSLNHLARLMLTAEKDLAAQPALAGYAATAATQIEAAATYVHEHDLQSVLGDVERLSKERPAVFMAVMVGVGMLIARFLKNTVPQVKKTAHP